MTKGTVQHYGLADREDCLVVIIDVQERLMPVISGKERVTANAVMLAKLCSICGIPVIVTEQQKLGPTVGEVKASITDFEPIEKIHFNCFQNDEFRAKVEGTGRKTLVLTGVESHICVTQTAIFALPKHQVHVIGDAISSRTPDNKQAALRRMRDAGAVISTTEMFVYEVLARAGTEEFRAILPLVK